MPGVVVVPPRAGRDDACVLSAEVPEHLLLPAGHDVIRINLNIIEIRSIIWPLC